MHTYRYKNIFYFENENFGNILFRNRIIVIILNIKIKKKLQNKQDGRFLR